MNKNPYPIKTEVLATLKFDRQWDDYVLNSLEQTRQIIERMEETDTKTEDILTVFDPGETTGWCVFKNQELILSGQDKWTLKELWEFIDYRQPTQILYERFSLYAHKAQQQINSEFPTVQNIGVIKLYAELYSIPIFVQTAQQGKAIWTDDKLKRFNFFTKNHHANDAIRHGLTYLKAHKRPEIRAEWDRE